MLPANLTNATVIGAGHYHSLAFTSDGRVVGWGDDSGGQTNGPIGLGGVIALAGGRAHSLALKSDGSVAAWGANHYGQANVPPGLTGLTAIAAGAYHSLALRHDGTVVAWGAGLTNTGSHPFLGQASVPADLSNVVAIAAGEYHSLALKADGTVVVWGLTSVSAPNTPPWGLTNAVAISAFANNLVLSAGGWPQILSAPENSTAYSGQHKYYNPQVAGLPPLSCQWRFNGTEIPGATNSSLSLTDLAETNAGVYTLIVTNAYGLANRSMTLQVINSPPLITQQPASLVVGERWDPRFSVRATGSEPLHYQWRCNGTNLLGTGSMFLTVSNAQVSQAGDYDVVISNRFGITLSSNAALRVLPVCVAAWGGKGDGQTYVPPGLTNVVAVSAGNGHALALMGDGTVVAWGKNIYDRYSKTNVPPGLSNVVAIASGSSHNLALKSNGTVVGWGALTAPPSAPTNVIGLAAGMRHNLVLKADGTVASWGASIWQTPPGLSNVVAVAACWSHSAALRRDGTVMIWSANSSESTVLSNNLSNVVAIAGAYEQFLALKRDGTLDVWGSSYYSPLRVPEGLSNVAAIAAGGGYFGSHALALQSDGTLIAWGYNNMGQTNVPPTSRRVAAISAGADLSLALLQSDPPQLGALLVNPRLTNSNFTIGIPTRNNRVYGLEYSSSQSHGVWAALPLSPGLGGVQMLTDPAATNSARFYRVRQW
jgi:alpha-tubulin suppressor-like RCC1 family protein